jgi:DNA-binding NarL/FixJ family response regulator
VSQLRVFLADDHTLFREGVRALLERQPTITVVGEAGDGREALKRIEETAPDLVIMDIVIPGLNGIEVTRQIKKIRPDLKVLVLSMYDDQEYAYEVLQAGASGYIQKDTVGQELINAIEVVSRGGCFLCSSIASKVVEHYVRRSDERGGPVAPPGELTPREREVLQLVVEGNSNAQVGTRLGISPKTVEVHRSRITSKLAIRDLPGLVKYAIRKGLIKA